MNSFYKNGMKKLLAAYSVPSQSTWKKDNLNTEIVKVISSAECITNHQTFPDKLKQIFVRSEG